MGTDTGGIIIIATGIAYGLILQHITGKRQNTDALVRAFTGIFAAGFAIHLILFVKMSQDSARTVTDWLLMTYFSIQYALEMFVAKTIAFKGAASAILSDNQILFTALLMTYYLAIITSAMVIFHFLSRWAYSRRWLFRKKNIKSAEDGGNHIFIGLSKASILLASDIRRQGCSGKIIFIDIPSKSDAPKGISIWDIISRFIFRTNKNEAIDADVILKADKRMKGVLPWLRNHDNNVYILSDDQDMNIRLAEKLYQLENVPEEAQLRCRIYCHAAKDGISSIYSSVTDIRDRLIFVDSSFLAIESLKTHDSAETYPVSFVKKAKDAKSGRLLGYVESGFTSAIIGFGETGREALKFLYEFGSFVGKDKEKVPFQCHIFDDNAAEEAGELKRKISFPNASEVHFTSCKVESERFWEGLGKTINEMNYIVVCLGDDQANLKIATEIAEFALRNGRDLKDNFIIAFRQREFSILDKETIEKANRTFGNCLRPFGMMKDIWTQNVISANDITTMAKKFYCSYLSATSQAEAETAWAERLTRLQSDDYATRNKARRQISQDYSNCLHAFTKRALCDARTAAAAEFIQDSWNDGQHVDKKRCTDEDAAVLEYLAVGEHIRWNASHIILGYRYAEDTSDLKCTHNCIVPYDALSEETRHYDWLVVKNSL